LKAVTETIDSIYPLSEEARRELLANVYKADLPKGHILFKEGEVSSKVFFIERGIARAFCYRNDQEVTFWFGTEGDLIFSYYSYVANKPGYETVELLEPAVVYVLELQQLQRLFLSNIEIANWGRKLAEYELIKTEERFIAFQFQSATQRYRSLLEQDPQLIQRVPLYHIASYLGVTQVTLSRIRAEIR
jgi:CRP-like cAMP-binding protein